jgi:hypothetical protein
MPNEQSGLPRRGWKDAGGAGARPPAGKRAWQATAPAAGPKKGWSRRTRLTVALGSVALVVGLVVVLIEMLRVPRPACVLLVGASYDTNLAIPHNAYGWKGLQDLKGLADKEGFVSSWWPLGRSGKLRRLQDEPRALRADDSWEDIWKDLPRRVEERTVVLFLALHGGAGPDGAYLLRNGDDPAGGSRLAVSKLLEGLQDRPELEGKNKVLILDATQVEADWLGGLLYNDFARQLREEAKRFPDLIILSASDEGERSWTCEEWGQTVFAHYVIEGLKGAAARGGNLRVSAWDLWQYVHDKVGAWAIANRDAAQTPVLLGNRELAKDVQLVQINDHYAGDDHGDGPDLKGLTDKLKPAWVEFHDLRDDPLSPALYSPQWWRLYRATLQRYEELLRAGDPTGRAADLGSQLRRLQDRIVKTRSPGLATASVGGTLAMPRALGAPSPPEKLAQAFNKLWVAGDNNPAARRQLKELLREQRTADQPGRAGQVLQARLTGLAFQELLQAPDSTTTQEFFGLLKKAHDFLEGTRADLAVGRSAEAHFLAMLVRDLKDGVPTADVKQALKVRRLAEEVALGVPEEAPKAALRSEVIGPWIEAEVKKADHNRGLGEDWLFGSQPSHWAKARDYLRQAEGGYAKARAKARDVARALNARDRALADLPYLARWAAGKREKGLQQEIRELTVTVDKLAAGLRGGDPADRKGGAAGRGEAQLAALGPLAATAGEKWQQLCNRFASECGKEAKDTVPSQRHWRDLQNLLGVPLAENVTTRLDMLRTSREVSRELLAKAHQAGAQPGGPALAAAKMQSLAQAEMALADAGTPLLLGQGTDYGRVLERARQDADWQRPLGEVGDAVGRHWQAMRQQVVSRLQTSTDPKKAEVSGNLERAAQELFPAEDYCRRLPGGALPAKAEPFDAVEGMRRLRLHDLLVWQAERTVAEHWWADEALGREKTYYQPAARAYLDDARRLALADPGQEALNRLRQARAQGTAEKLQVRQNDPPRGLLVEGPGNRSVTMRQHFKVSWQLKPDQGVPGQGDGVPMLALQVGKSLKAEDKATQRAPALELPGTVKYPVNVVAWDGTKEPPLIPEREPPTTATLSGVYRGQRIERETRIGLYKTADVIVYRHAPRSGARLAFRMDQDFNYGAISIVLDMSNSMNEKVGKTGKKKFALAMQALKRVLNQVPRGTYVSLCTFGHSPVPVAVGTWDKTKIKWLRPCKQWDRAQTDALIRYIGGWFPGHTSPIAEALVVAKEEGFPERDGDRPYRGPKVILALTDGDDNALTYDAFCYLKGTPLARTGTNSVARFLRKEFEDSGIEVNVICFAAEKGEEDRAKAQFGVFGELDPQGSFLPAPTPRDLAAKLEWALRPRMHVTGDNGRPPGFPKDGLAVTRRDENLKWCEKPIPAGGYKARIHGPSSQTRSQEINLRDGESLIVTLRRKEGQVLYERALFSEEARRSIDDRLLPQRRTGKDWAADVLQNKADLGHRELTQLVTLEDQAGRAGGAQPIEHRVPTFVWLDLKGADGKPPLGLRWYRDARYPAPAFEVRSGWPNPPEAKTEAEVRWSDGELKPGLFATRAHPAGQRLDDFAPAEVALADCKAVIEKVSVESRPVKVGPDRSREQRTCLVVQILYEPKKPVWVRIPQLAAVGQGWGEEHHYFTEANRYTAIFWGLSDFQARAFSLEVVSLEAFKSAYPSVELRIPAPTPAGTGLDEADRFHWSGKE